MKIYKTVKALVLTIIISTTALVAQQMQMSPVAPVDSVSEAELEQFVSVAMDFQSIRMEMDNLIIDKLDEVEMPVERFQEIMMSQQNLQAPEVTLTTQEEQKVANLQTFLQEISVKAQQQQVASIQESEMTQQRFQSIAQALQTDQELAMRFQEMIAEKEAE
tara:strand:- start:29496 stop:29981 length:486 start_codon:yes stop_codon:yes gene_type:complete